MKAKITEIFERFSEEYLQKYSATINQHKVIKCIINCRTETLGYNIEQCEDCGHRHTHYNSCSNRHCPNCQAINKDKWILAKQSDILPVKYYHVVFTVPADLRTLFKFNKKLLYNLLFKCVWETIESFSADKRNRIEAKMGMIAILHSWKQNLDYHPHLHCIIPAGGITANHKWKTSPINGDYLFNTEALSITFRGKFMHYLKKFYKNNDLKFWDLKQRPSAYFYNLKEELYSKQWVVYAKESFKNEQSVFEYLGRYTHKIAISNYRIKKITGTSVSFEYTDRTDSYKKKIRTVSGVEFIKLFLQHVLPHRFMKIRNYGFLSSRVKSDMLTKLRAYFDLSEYQKPVRLLVAEILELVYGIEPGVCPKCKGRMILIGSKARPRASPLIAR